MKSKKTFELKGNKVILRPDDVENLWDGDWGIFLKDGDRERIGSFSFAGEKELGSVPVSITIDDIHYRNRGFGTEAIRMMREWAFYHRSVYELRATCDHENSGAIMALQKAGFVFRDGTRTIENYTATKQKTSWMGLYLCIGIAVGLALVVVTELTWPSMILGIAPCLTLGAVMDAKEDNYRKKVTGKK